MSTACVEMSVAANLSHAFICEPEWMCGHFSGLTLSPSSSLAVPLEWAITLTIIFSLSTKIVFIHMISISVWNVDKFNCNIFISLAFGTFVPGRIASSGSGSNNSQWQCKIHYSIASIASGRKTETVAARRRRLHSHTRLTNAKCIGMQTNICLSALPRRTNNARRTNE